MRGAGRREKGHWSPEGYGEGRAWEERDQKAERTRAGETTEMCFVVLFRGERRTAWRRLLTARASCPNWNFMVEIVRDNHVTLWPGRLQHHYISWNAACVFKFAFATCAGPGYLTLELASKIDYSQASLQNFLFRCLEFGSV